MIKRVSVAPSFRDCVKMGIKVNINPRLHSWGANNQQDSINRFNSFELASMSSHSL